MVKEGNTLYLGGCFSKAGFYTGAGTLLYAASDWPLFNFPGAKGKYTGGNSRWHRRLVYCRFFLELGTVVLVNLAPYSPDLNPIERLWKQVKKATSEQALIKTVEELEEIISTTFESCCTKLSFAKSWIENIYKQVFQNCPIVISNKLGRSLY